MDEPMIADVDRVEVVLFDLGGVVFEFDWAPAFRIWSTHSGVAVGELEARFSKVGDYERYERGEITSEEYFSLLADQLGIGSGPAVVARGWNAIFGELVPGITEVIAAVRASPLRIAALSNTNAAHAATFGARYAAVLADLGRIFTSHELGHRKPEPAAYAATCDRLATPPEAVLFFDDTAANVDAARAFGMQAVPVTSIGDVTGALAELDVALPDTGVER